MAGRRRYTRTQKAEAVAKAMLTSTEAAAEELGIPRTTLVYWLDQPQFVELRSKSRDIVAEQMWATIQIGVDELAKGLVDPLTELRDKALTVGILYDKHALLTGDATARTESRDLTGTLPDSDISAAIREAEHLIAAGEGRAAAEAEDTPEG